MFFKFILNNLQGQRRVSTFPLSNPSELIIGTSTGAEPSTANLFGDFLQSYVSWMERIAN